MNCDRLALPRLPHTPLASLAPLSSHERGDVSSSALVLWRFRRCFGASSCPFPRHSPLTRFMTGVRGTACGELRPSCPSPPPAYPARFARTPFVPRKGRGVVLRIVFVEVQASFGVSSCPFPRHSPLTRLMTGVRGTACGELQPSCPSPPPAYPARFARTPFVPRKGRGVVLRIVFVEVQASFGVSSCPFPRHSPLTRFMTGVRGTACGELRPSCPSPPPAYPARFARTPFVPRKGRGVVLRIVFVEVQASFGVSSCPFPRHSPLTRFMTGVRGTTCGELRPSCPSPPPAYPARFARAPFVPRKGRCVVFGIGFVEVQALFGVSSSPFPRHSPLTRLMTGVRGTACGELRPSCPSPPPAYPARFARAPFVPRKGRGSNFLRLGLVGWCVGHLVCFG